MAEMLWGKRLFRQGGESGKFLKFLNGGELMRTAFLLVMAAGSMAVAGCGVPRSAGALAAQCAAGATTLPADAAGVRAGIAAQDGEWSSLAGLLRQKEFGGITGVDAGFVQLVDQTAALAKREHGLVTQGADDPVLDREALQRFGELWQSADKYLNQ
jgi:hypothetical protein